MPSEQDLTVPGVRELSKEEMSELQQGGAGPGIEAPKLRHKEVPEWESSFEDDENVQWTITIPFRQFIVFVNELTGEQIAEYDAANERMSEQLNAIRSTPDDDMESIKVKRRAANRIMEEQHQLTDSIIERHVFKITENGTERDKNKLRRTARTPLVDLIVGVSNSGRGSVSLAQT